MKTLKPLFHAFVMNATSPDVRIPPSTYNYCYGLITSESSLTLTSPSIPKSEITTTYISSISVQNSANRIYLGNNTGTIDEYELINNDLTTFNKLRSFDLTQTLGIEFPDAFTFGDNGRKMYVSGYKYNDHKFVEFTLNEPWNMETVQYSGNYITSSGSNRWKGSAINNDGTIMYVVWTNYTGDDTILYRYKLNTPWSFSESSRELLDSHQIYNDDTLYGCHISGDGTQISFNTAYSNTWISTYVNDIPWGSCSGFIYNNSYNLITGKQVYGYSPNITREYHYVYNANDNVLQKYSCDNVTIICEDRLL